MIAKFSGHTTYTRVYRGGAPRSHSRCTRWRYKACHGLYLNHRNNFDRSSCV